VASAVQAANVNVATGTLNGPSQATLVHVNGQLMNAEAWKKQIIAWRNDTASKWTYTSELIASQSISPEEYRITVHLEGDFPQRPALVAAQCGQMLDGQARLGDDEQHARQAARLMDRLDNQYFGNLHARRFLCQSSNRGAEGYDGEQLCGQW